MDQWWDQKERAGSSAGGSKCASYGRSKHSERSGPAPKSAILRLRQREETMYLKYLFAAVPAALW
jgi:hypothetical protein